MRIHEIGNIVRLCDFIRKSAGHIMGPGPVVIGARLWDKRVVRVKLCDEAEPDVELKDGIRGDLYDVVQEFLHEGRGFVTREVVSDGTIHTLRWEIS